MGAQEREKVASRRPIDSPDKSKTKIRVSRMERMQSGSLFFPFPSLRKETIFSNCKLNVESIALSLTQTITII